MYIHDDDLQDVFGVTGDKYRTGPETNIQAILGKPVDLTARYQTRCL